MLNKARKIGCLLLGSLLVLTACSISSSSSPAGNPEEENVMNGEELIPVGQLQSMLSADGSKSFILGGIGEFTKVSQLTGIESPNKTDQYALHGTDLGSMFNVGDTTYFVFGDSYSVRPEGMTGGGGSYWRSNTMAYSTDTEFHDGITFDGAISDKLNMAIELIRSEKRNNVEITKIPTHGLYANDAMYLYFMSVNNWGPAGVWDANFAGVAKSTDMGQSWTVIEGLEWPGDSHFIQVSPYRIYGEGMSEADIYFWTIPAGRFGGVKLMKVKESRIEELDQYMYYAGVDQSGQPIWSPDMEKAEFVLRDTVGELSVIWNPYLERWIMTYLRPASGIVLREGLTPWGPWGDLIELSGEEHQWYYGPYMNPKYMEGDGKTVYMTLSHWMPYNVFWYKMTLLRNDE